MEIKKCTVSPEDVARVKGMGFLWDKNTEDCFNARVLSRSGRLTAAQTRAIADAADTYGSGAVVLTVRMNVEIQGVPYENIDALCQYLAGFGLETGSTGAKVRSVVSCKGTTCHYGLIDAYALSDRLQDTFYKPGVKLPHKFKIGVSGCPNKCIKPDLNDVGIIGQRMPVPDVNKCRRCGKCAVESACPIKVAHVGEDGIAMNGCINCGRCAGKCPFGAIDYVDGYRLFIGGRWGKQVQQGRPINKLLKTEDEVVDLTGKVIELFRAEGKPGERLAVMVDRLGFENVEEQLLK